MKWNLILGMFWAAFTAYDLTNGNWVFGTIELIFAIYHISLFTKELQK